MRKDLKTFFNLSKYAIGYKSNLVMSIVFGVVGLMWDICSFFFPDMFLNGFDAGAYFMILAGATFSQTSFTVIYSGIGASSKEYRNILLKYSTIIMTIFSLSGITLSLFIHFASVTRTPDILPKISFTLIQIGLFAFCIQAYFAIAYKIYALSSVFFILIIIPLMFIGTYFDLFNKMSSFSVVMATILCYALTILGTISYYVIAKLLYKKPFDSQAFRVAIAKASK